MDIFTSAAFQNGGTEEALIDKVRALERLITESPTPDLLLQHAEPAAADDATQIHTPSYVSAVLSGAPEEVASSCGLPWTPAIPVRALASLGVARATAVAAQRDGAAVGLLAGEHHAHPNHGAGYCVFNGTALTAHTLIAEGANRVLVVDFDAHCGGGTVAVLGGDDRFRHVDVSLNLIDTYQPAPGADLHIVDHADDYLDTIELALSSVPKGWADAVVYTHGVDPHELDSHGGIDGVTDMVIRLRERILSDWIRAPGVPLAVAGAGGYASFRTTPDAVARLHMMAIDEAATLATAGRIRTNC